MGPAPACCQEILCYNRSAPVVLFRIRAEVVELADTPS
jgi:hypothetical protein